MSGLRNLIRTTILRTLSDGKPRKARELAAVLRYELKRDDIDRHEVNSVLYRDLSGTVECDSAFNWQLPMHKATASKDFPEREQDTRPGMIRTIYRLRSGLPPCENLELVTVGKARIVGVVKGLIKPKSVARSPWAIVRGDYGGGKTHTLTLFADMARQEGYATCQVSADGYANALNHPQRFLPSLLATLEIPLSRTYSYTDFLYEVLSDIRRTRRLLAIAETYLAGWSWVASNTLAYLHAVLQSLSDGGAHSEGWNEQVRIITYHLTGNSVRHLSAAPSYRQTAYNLLSIARDLLLETGMSGLAIGIDEIESIYTKLPKAQSRQGALRVLARFCSFAHCRALLGVTPDAFREFVSDDSLTVPDNDALPGEDVPKWAKALKSGAVPVLDCQPLTPEERVTLLEAVREAYACAYGNKPVYDGFKKIWDKHIQLSANPQVPVRLIVRQAVDLLDGFRYSSDFQNWA